MFHRFDRDSIIPGRFTRLKEPKMFSHSCKVSFSLLNTHSIRLKVLKCWNFQKIFCSLHHPNQWFACCTTCCKIAFEDPLSQKGSWTYSFLLCSLMPLRFSKFRKHLLFFFPCLCHLTRKRIIPSTFSFYIASSSIFRFSASSLVASFG